MHQAIEAKEGVAIKDENQTLATITLQNYFRLYEKLSGMTGTAMTEANEFHQIYKLGVVPIPTNMPMIRDDQADVVYQTAQSKFEACVEDIVECHEAGQPVLVGTVSVEKSEILSKLLKRRGVPHEVLNAKYHEREALIVAQAGRKGAVTVATNMAGRGTDIMLGGNPEFIADQELHQRGLSPVETPEDYEAAWPEAVAKAKRAVAEEHEEVVEAGGLYVLGTERHESRRIDNQLRGRSGRQGDPGKSRFYLSLEDDLMRLFNSDRVGAIMERLSIPADVPVESKVVTRAIRSAQTQVEQQNFEIRKDVLKYDDVMNRQRVVIYGERRRVLEGADLHEQIREMVDEVVAGYVAGETSDGYPEEWDLDKLWQAFRQLFPIGISVDDVVEDVGGERAGLSGEFIAEAVITDAQAAYERREEEFGSEVMRELERRVVLSVLDRKWREHLYEMDYLREGVGLRAYGQRDPLVEYQREGYDMFGAMMEGIKEESVGNLFNLQVQVQENPIVEEAAPDAEASLGALEAPGVAAAVDAPEAAGPASRAGTPAPGVPGSQPAGAQARGSTSAGVQQDRRAQQNRRAQQGQRGQQDQRRQQDQRGQQEPAGQSAALPAGLGPRRAQRLEYSAPSVDGGAHVETSRGPAAGDDYARVGRNDPCPCGSGRKFKRCHGDPRMRADG
jgi:preprotein translocase subunit SecA